MQASTLLALPQRYCKRASISTTTRWLTFCREWEGIRLMTDVYRGPLRLGFLHLTFISSQTSCMPATTSTWDREYKEPAKPTLQSTFTNFHPSTLSCYPTTMRELFLTCLPYTPLTAPATTLIRKSRPPCGALCRSLRHRTLKAALRAKETTNPLVKSTTLTSFRACTSM